MNVPGSPAPPIQRPPAETVYAAELAALRAEDRGVRPPGWGLSLAGVKRFILGADGETGKIVCPPALIERAMVTLATGRGLLLTGAPGTGKSLLSELLAAAICGRSTLVIQGSAALSEDQIKYGWNYALLVSEGPSRRALVPAPLYRGMEQGLIVRFEEITRCPAEVQDCLLAALSERMLAVPELGEEALLFAAEGFNLIATANSADRGVNEMSAALKRRFNFETVFPIADEAAELALVKRAAARLLARSGVPTPPSDAVLEGLVRCFRDLRADGEAAGGRPAAAMSTAEAVNVAHAIGVRGHYLRGDAGRAEDIVECLAGTAAKDNPAELARLRRWLDQCAVRYSGAVWRALHDARHLLVP